MLPAVINISVGVPAVVVVTVIPFNFSSIPYPPEVKVYIINVPLVKVLGGFWTFPTENDKLLEEVAGEDKVITALRLVLVIIEQTIPVIKDEMPVQLGEFGKVMTDGGVTSIIKFSGTVFFGVIVKVYVVNAPLTKLAIDAVAEFKVFGVVTVTAIFEESWSIVHPSISYVVTEKLWTGAVDPGFSTDPIVNSNNPEEKLPEENALLIVILLLVTVQLKLLELNPDTFKQLLWALVVL